MPLLQLGEGEGIVGEEEVLDRMRLVGTTPLSGGDGPLLGPGTMHRGPRPPVADVEQAATGVFDIAAGENQFFAGYSSKGWS